jgi:hypothetical protein
LARDLQGYEVINYALFVGANAKQSQHYYPQFAQMIDVAIFLFGKIGGPTAELTASIDVGRDSPMTVCKQLLSAANVRI